MGKTFVKHLKAGELTHLPLMIKQTALTPYRNRPGQYLQLLLGDRTGDLICRVWVGGEEIYSKFIPGEVVWVEGRIVEYNGQLQLQLRAPLRLAAPPDYDPEDYLAALPPAEQDRLLAEFRQTAEALREPLRRLVLGFLEESKFVQALKAVPAAKQFHHAYRGGLLEHTLGVARLAGKMAEAYPELVDRDLLIAGALLHDIGKVKEFEERGLVEYSIEGRMLGHIMLGAQMVAEQVARIDGFPEELRMKVLHLLISHHGEYEWQSPKRPKLVEALLLHRADLTDADMHKFTRLAGTGMVYSKELNRYVYVGSSLGPDQETMPEGVAAGWEEEKS